MSGFTLNQLKKRLDKLIGEGHGRRRVCVSKTTFRHNCEDDGQRDGTHMSGSDPEAAAALSERKPE